MIFNLSTETDKKKLHCLYQKLSTPENITIYYNQYGGVYVSFYLLFHYTYTFLVIEKRSTYFILYVSNYTNYFSTIIVIE